MPNRVQFQNEDLVLRVSPSIDPTRFDINKYEPFLDALCETREYQKQAIRDVLRYFLSGRYKNLRDLAEENYSSNPILQERYGTFREMERHLQLPNQLSCSVDLATATGKSYVMYGIARIMLAHGAVDRVLVLCPSRTIETGLLEKFRALSADATLRSLIPETAYVRNPTIIIGTESIVEGVICVENVHATLPHVGSSIRDSLKDKGEKTLVLNDEVHHVYNPTGRDLKKWKEFLLDTEFGFHLIAGFSGTCYTNNEYFTDVIARYSLRQAIEQGYAKSIDYVVEDMSVSQDEKFQKIYDNHQQNRNVSYRKVKPLTILVTKDISAASRLATDIVRFLSEQEKITSEDAEKKVLLVTSSRKHAHNVLSLKFVDRADNPIEWIVSVSMLTEGWDVQNVFQIVPHEERAFNSKLLIAQVLGRGLRIPEAYRGEHPIVTVFNHDAWSSRIRHLVTEVLELEKRAYSYPVHKATDYNFILHNIDYDKIEDVETFEQTGEYEFTKGYVSLVTQKATLEQSTTYTRAISGEERQKKTLISYRMFSLQEVAEHIHSKLKAIDIEEGTTYSEKYSISWLQELIRNSLRRIGEEKDQVSEDNRQRLQKSFGVIHRKASQVARYRSKAKDVIRIDTADRNRNSAGYGTVKRDATIIYDEHTLQLSDDETQVVLREMIADYELPRRALEEVRNSYYFKTPLNLVIASHEPEWQFVRELTKVDNASALDSWIKSTDQDFYSIEYSWLKGEHRKLGFFNPDFFIKQDNHIWVIEIKDDEQTKDPSPENKGKYKAGKAHFETLNTKQNEAIYHFHFLTPRSYAMFFECLRSKTYNFASHLDVVLGENGV